MTLGDFFQHLDHNPSMVVFYFLLLPVAALLGNIFGKGEGELSPWKYYYSALV